MDQRALRAQSSPSTATVAVGVAGSLAVATTAGAKTKRPKSGVETPSGGTVTETGSTLMYPLFNLWAGGYNTKYPSVTISTGFHRFGHRHHRRRQRHGRHRRI